MLEITKLEINLIFSISKFVGNLTFSSNEQKTYASVYRRGHVVYIKHAEVSAQPTLERA